MNTTARSPRSRFSSIAPRFVLCLTLVPIVPAISSVVAMVMDSFAPGTDAAFRWFHISLTVLWMGGLIVIARTAVIWTFGRTGLTALVSLIPFVQIVWNKPLWNAGCIADDVLMAGQHYVSCGLWTWLAVWVWWGVERTIMAEQKGAHQSRRPAWLARLGASLGMFPLVTGLFWIVAIFVETFLPTQGSTRGLEITFATCAVIMLPVWLLIWRRAVEWSRSTLTATMLGWAVVVGLPLIGLFLLPAHSGPIWKSLAYSSPIIGWGVWLGWTMWYWPMRTEAWLAPADEPSCLKCGYSLRGLKATRCPECGDEPTIDELWAGSISSNPKIYVCP